MNRCYVWMRLILLHVTIIRLVTCPSSIPVMGRAQIKTFTWLNETNSVSCTKLTCAFHTTKTWSDWSRAHQRYKVSGIKFELSTHSQAICRHRLSKNGSTITWPTKCIIQWKTSVFNAPLKRISSAWASVNPRRFNGSIWCRVKKCTNRSSLVETLIEYSKYCFWTVQNESKSWNQTACHVNKTALTRHVFQTRDSHLTTPNRRLSPSFGCWLLPWQWQY